MTTITALPTPPSRQDPLNFAERADDFLGALPAFVTETNLVASELNTANSEAQAAASDAQDSAALAETAANAATAIANITAWQSGNTYAVGDVVYSLVNFLSYRRKTAGAGTTDPSTDSTNWQIISNTGDVTLTGVQTLTNKTLTTPVITTPVITGTRETKVAMAANNIDLSTANYFTKTISGATTLTVSNVPASGTTASFILDLTNGGSATITWFSGVTWPGGIAPTLTASGRDVLGFYTYDAGTTWTGLVLGLNVKAA